MSDNLQNDFVFIKSELAVYRIDLKDIYFIEGQKDYILIHTGSNVFKTHITMKEIEENLPEKDFVRIHKSYIVRLDKIFYIKYPNLLVDKKMKMLQIGSTFKENLYKKLNIISEKQK